MGNKSTNSPFDITGAEDISGGSSSGSVYAGSSPNSGNKGDRSILGKRRVQNKRIVYGWESTEIIQWKEGEVFDWLGCIGFSQVFSEKVLREINSGKSLYLLDNSDEIFNEVTDERQLFVFLVYLHYLKHCVRVSEMFSFRFHFVLTKMMRIGDVMRDWGYKELAVMCSLLSKPESIKKHFLDSRDGARPGKSVKLKLIITETTFSKGKQILRKIIAPVLNRIPTLRQDFGLFHSALLIGPFYLEWTNSELVIPKQIKSGSAYLTIDIPPIEMRTTHDFDTVKEILSEIIAKWNTEFRYSSIPSEKSKKGNCQNFITDICNALGIEIKVDGALKDFVDELNEVGECKLSFKPNKQFVDDFLLEKYLKRKYRRKDGSYKILFPTHKALDDFTFYCYKTNAEGYLTHQAEYTLLKSFDRAFWLRHLKNQNEPMYKPAPVDTERRFGTLDKFFTGCPFLDPRDTRSFC